ncbi:MAG: tRNA lysidine(34) synthetase TilS [Clostridia bacterium]|nr:tRNA lysidine(34) synthetase TilS [Clostridia bacterium]
MSSYEKVRSAFRLLLTELIGEKRPAILVALSGGADSSLLLHLLKEEGFPVGAAHLHHGIRGEEADRDEAFCRSLCHTLGVPFFSQRIDVPLMAKEWGMGVEEAAREVRYRFLQDTAREHGFPYLATAHNADDNLETVLFHLARGTGLRGLCGIPSKRDNLLRPLLDCTKEDILKACEEKNIPFVTDSTNYDVNYTRNFIRGEIVPLLRRINPKVSDAVRNTVRCLAEDDKALSAVADRYDFSCGRQALASLPDGILSRVILRELREAEIAPEGRHIKAVATAIRSDSVRTSLSLPGGVLALDRDTLSTALADPPVYDIPLKEGFTPLTDEAGIFLGSSQNDHRNEINHLKNIYKLSINAAFNFDTMKKALRARTRKAGDVIRYGGMTRSVKKLLQSQKAPLALRDALPFVTSGDTVLWIPGFSVADEAAPKKGEASLPIIYFYRKRQSDL